MIFRLWLSYLVSCSQHDQQIRTMVASMITLIFMQEFFFVVRWRWVHVFIFRFFFYSVLTFAVSFYCVTCLRLLFACSSASVDSLSACTWCAIQFYYYFVFRSVPLVCARERCIILFVWQRLVVVVLSIWESPYANESNNRVHTNMATARTWVDVQRADMLLFIVALKRWIDSQEINDKWW